MPIQQSEWLTNGINGSHSKRFSKDYCRQLLREKECLAYHKICSVFRAQGRLTSEKLKLLKEIASSLSIPEVRHKAECMIAVNNKELNTIAECVAGPGTDIEWRREAKDPERLMQEEIVMSSSFPVADALAQYISHTLISEPNCTHFKKVVTLKSLWANHCHTPRIHSKNKNQADSPENKVKVEPKSLLIDGAIKVDENDDDDSSSTVSTTSDTTSLDSEKAAEHETRKTTDPDYTLMPPPQPPPMVSPIPPLPPQATTSLPPLELLPPPISNPLHTSQTLTSSLSTQSLHPSHSPTRAHHPPREIQQFSLPSSSQAAPPIMSTSASTLPPVDNEPPSHPLTKTPPPHQAFPSSPTKQASPSLPQSNQPSPSQSQDTVILPSLQVSPSPEAAQAPAISVPTPSISFPPIPTVTTLPPPTSTHSLPPAVISVPLPSSVLTVPATPAVITVPPHSSLLPVPVTPAVITVPPSSSILTFASPNPAVITVPPSTSLPDVPATSVVPDVSQNTPGTPIVSQDLEFAPLPDCMDMSLPPLVVVPPPEPVVKAIQIMEDIEEIKSRKRTISEDTSVTLRPKGPSPKTMALSAGAKMKPVMVSATTGLKVAPAVSKTPQSAVQAPTQRVIIVSNTSTSSTPMIQQTRNTSFLRAALPGSSWTTQDHRPRIIKARPRLQIKEILPNTKQDITNNLVKKVSFGSGTPAKILPKPQAPVVIVRSGVPTQNIQSPVGIQAGGQTRMLSQRLAEGSGSKQNVVILQAGPGKSRSVTLTNVQSKDMVPYNPGKLMPKKCVIINSAKTLPKRISPKPPISVPMSSGNNVVVLDLTQEQYRQNLSSTTLAELLQASGILAVSSAAPTVSTTPPLTTTATNSLHEGLNVQEINTLSPGHIIHGSEAELASSWLSAEAGKNLASEEVALPLGQSESIVTLDEAVELLGDSTQQQMEVKISEPSDEPVFIVKPGESVGNAMSTSQEFTTSHVVVESLANEGCADTAAVTIQHNDIDMPTNMSLEDYSSQQLENQRLN